jgi:hypothetical protein
MSERAKSSLEKLVNTYGNSLCSEPARLKGLLYDICPSNRKEITALLLVIQEGLIFELKISGNNRLLLQILAERLHSTTGIDKTIARWSLRAWADVLGLGVAPKTKRRSRARPRIVRPVEGKRTDGEPAISKPYAQRSGNTAPVTAPVQAPPISVAQQYPSKISSGSSAGQASPISATQHYSSKTATGSATALPVNRQWILITGLALVSLLVIIGYGIMRERNSPVPLPPVIINSVPPNNSDINYSKEEIDKAARRAWHEFLAERG